MWTSNSTVTCLCLCCAVSLPRTENFWRQSEHRHATGLPSILSITISCGIDSSISQSNYLGCSIENRVVLWTLSEQKCSLPGPPLRVLLHDSLRRNDEHRDSR